MNDKQIIINQMMSGNEGVISAGVNSESGIVALNAILAGTRFRITDSTFIEGVRNIARKSCESIMGIPLKK